MCKKEFEKSIVRFIPENSPVDLSLDIQCGFGRLKETRNAVAQSSSLDDERGFGEC